MYPAKIPKFIQRLFPSYFFSIPTTEKVIYLTFDDGPIPEVTPWVLEQLAAYNAKATFFMIGDNVRKYPEVYQQVIDGNHAIGNHTFNHLNGWKTDNETYFENVQKCAETIDTKLFRPPYGKLKPSQAKYLRKQYKIILWEILSGDFDKNISSERCLENVLNNTKNGSIIVFHDSLKAEKHLRFVLPKILKHFHKKGFQFQLITDN
jgi:peptidoglycan/xylan/chitin deacetylase (PgdA/CDA1 family)|tara:strand:+ start:51 stop:668 length:618 start_codon:yes stop_codon:yes gene_type:complete